MREIDKYVELKKKLEKLCDDNGLTFSIQTKYPYLLTIRPEGGMDAQLTMLETADYIDPDAALVFAYQGDELTHKISGTWTLSDDLFNKLKKAFKDLFAMYTAYFFREMYESGMMSRVNDRPSSHAVADSAPSGDEGDTAEVPDDDSEEDDFEDEDGDTAVFAAY